MNKTSWHIEKIVPLLMTGDGHQLLTMEASRSYSTLSHFLIAPSPNRL